MKTKKLEIKTLVTQTIERTYTMEVPVEKSKEDIKELFESGNVTGTYFSNETDEIEVSQKVLSITDLDALERQIHKDEARITED